MNKAILLGIMCLFFIGIGTAAQDRIMVVDLHFEDGNISVTNYTISMDLNLTQDMPLSLITMSG